MNTCEVVNVVCTRRSYARVTEAAEGEWRVQWAKRVQCFGVPDTLAVDDGRDPGNGVPAAPYKCV